jgi:hypothetical protein
MMIFERFLRRKPQRRRRHSPGVLRAYDRGKIEEGWGKIDQLLGVGKPSAAKEAVINADKLLDYALSQIVSGESTGEKLKNARRAFPQAVYQELWEAHKVRNALVHETDYELTQLVARDALSKFKRAFRSLGVRLT